jgi:MFS family permease
MGLCCKHITLTLEHLLTLSTCSNGLNILPSYSDYFGLNDAQKGPALTGLMTASIWIGGILAGISYGWVTDKIGRRPALFWAAVITVVAVIIQSASQNIGMFVFARVLIGYGTTASGLTGPAYLAETLPLHHRAWGLGLFNDFYYVGASHIRFTCVRTKPVLIDYRGPNCCWHYL